MPTLDGIGATMLELMQLQVVTMGHDILPDHRRGYSAHDSILQMNADQINRPTCIHKHQKYQIAAFPFHWDISKLIRTAVDSEDNASDKMKPFSLMSIVLNTTVVCIAWMILASSLTPNDY